MVADLDGDADVVALLGAFRALAASGSATCREACAAALPVVLRAATPRR